jgi:hypothetical protein
VCGCNREETSHAPRHLRRRLNRPLRALARPVVFQIDRRQAGAHKRLQIAWVARAPRQASRAGLAPIRQLCLLLDTYGTHSVFAEGGTGRAPLQPLDHTNARESPLLVQGAPSAAVAQTAERRTPSVLTQAGRERGRYVPALHAVPPTPGAAVNAADLVWVHLTIPLIVASRGRRPLISAEMRSNSFSCVLLSLRT